MTGRSEEGDASGGSAGKRYAVWERLAARVDAVEDVKKVPWEERERNLIAIQGLVEHAAREIKDFHGGQQEKEELVGIVRTALGKMRRPLEANLRDLRSVIVRETCKVLMVCFDFLGNIFSKVAQGLITCLLEQVRSGNKTIASYADQCCKHLFETIYVQSAPLKLINVMFESKSKDVREQCIGYLLVILRKWSHRRLSRHVHALQDSLVKLFRDPSSKVRAQARECFAQFAKLFPEATQVIVYRTDERTQRTLQKKLEQIRASLPQSQTISDDRDSESLRSGNSSVADSGSSVSLRGSLFSQSENLGGETFLSWASRLSKGSVTSTDNHDVYSDEEDEESTGNLIGTLGEIEEREDLSATLEEPDVESRSVELKSCSIKIPVVSSSAEEATSIGAIEESDSDEEARITPNQETPPSAIEDTPLIQPETLPGPQSLRHLIQHHRQFINGLIGDLAADLQVLKHFEAAESTAIAPPTDDMEKSRAYSDLLFRSLDRHEEKIKQFKSILL